MKEQKSKRKERVLFRRQLDSHDTLAENRKKCINPIPKDQWGLHSNQNATLKAVTIIKIVSDIFEQPS